VPVIGVDAPGFFFPSQPAHVAADYAQPEAPPPAAFRNERRGRAWPSQESHAPADGTQHTFGCGFAEDECSSTSPVLRCRVGTESQLTKRESGHELAVVLLRSHGPRNRCRNFSKRWGAVRRYRLGKTAAPPHATTKSARQIPPHRLRPPERRRCFRGGAYARSIHSK
jgi:hypothetical protein